MKYSTNVYLLLPIWRDLVGHIFVAKEMEALKRIEEEISKVLIHVYSQDPAVKAIYGSPTIHNLQDNYPHLLHHLKKGNYI